MVRTPAFPAVVVLGAVLAAPAAALAQGAWPFPFGPASGEPQNPEPRASVLPPDADPAYSSPVDHDDEVDMALTTRRLVADPTGEPPGTLTINTKLRKLFLSLGDGHAFEYGIGVGRQGFTWKGVAEIGRKAFWPGWTPPPEMLARQPDLAEHMDGGLDNPSARGRFIFSRGTRTRCFAFTEPTSRRRSATPCPRGASAC